MERYLAYIDDEVPTRKLQGRTYLLYGSPRRPSQFRDHSIADSQQLSKTDLEIAFRHLGLLLTLDEVSILRKHIADSYGYTVETEAVSLPISARCLSECIHRTGRCDEPPGHDFDIAAEGKLTFNVRGYSSLRNTDVTDVWRQHQIALGEQFGRQLLQALQRTAPEDIRGIVGSLYADTFSQGFGVPCGTDLAVTPNDVERLQAPGGIGADGLYRAYSEFTNPAGQNMCMNWFRDRRTGPAIPYERTIADYHILPLGFRVTAQEWVDELFTVQEATILGQYVGTTYGLPLRLSRIQLPANRLRYRPDGYAYVHGSEAHSPYLDGVRKLHIAAVSFEIIGYCSTVAADCGIAPLWYCESSAREAFARAFLAKLGIEAPEGLTVMLHQLSDCQHHQLTADLETDDLFQKE